MSDVKYLKSTDEKEIGFLDSFDLALRRSLLLCICFEALSSYLEITRSSENFKGIKEYRILFSEWRK